MLRTKLNIEVLILEALINSYFNPDKFTSVNDVLREDNERKKNKKKKKKKKKKEIKNLEIPVEYTV